MSREEKILASIEPSMRILELGPLHNPVAAKRDGWSTCIVDHGSREELVEKYRTDENVDVTRIEDVDVVWNGGPLDAAFPAEQLGTFDACIVSHVLEHIPDPIGLFRSLERILRPTGIVSLAVPDKRFCFDFFKPPSTVGELLDAHARRATRHSGKTRFDQEAYSVRSAGTIAWGRHRVTDIEFITPLADAKRAFDTHGTLEEDPYVDCHAWQFTPSSFELAVLELGALGELDFRVARSFPTAGCEFYVTLRRGRAALLDDPDLDAKRLELFEAMLRELREQADLLDRTPPSANGRTPVELLAAVLRRARVRALGLRNR